MVALIKRRPIKSTAAWHAGFLAMLPVIRNYARGAFGHLKADLRQDLIQEVIANCMVAYVRLFKQGKVALAYPTVLARYGIAQVRDHRRVGASLNIKDVLSPYCQAKKHVVVECLDKFERRGERVAGSRGRRHPHGHRPRYCRLPVRLRRLAQDPPPP